MKNIIFGWIMLCALISSAQSTLEKDKAGNIIGIAQKEDFLQAPFVDWFNFNYEDYSVDTELLKKIKPLLKKVNIKSFMGTWCGDSQEQTPVFYKILDEANFNYKKLEMIAVNRKKKTPAEFEKGLDILRVPTFIFYKKGKEIGRIVEFPMETIEADMLKILSGEAYKHAYEE